MALLIKTLGALTAVVLLVATLLGSLLTLGGFLLAAIKVLIIVVFVAILALIMVSIIRDRSHRRRSSEDF